MDIDWHTERCACCGNIIDGEGFWLHAEGKIFTFCSQVCMHAFDIEGESI